MSKNLVIKFAISLIFAAFIYVLFWFFKVGQLEKRITKFISDNSTYISSGSIKSYGFPLSQNVVIKDLRFSIPNPILSNRQISISELTATSGIFADSFSVTFPQGVSTQNSKGEIARVKFNSEPVVHVKISDSNNVGLLYEDSGYSMRDPKKNLVLAVKSSKISISINGNDRHNIKVSVDSDIKEVEGFDVVDIYNNILRDDIIKGIQTGKIKVGSSHIIENNDSIKDIAPIVETPKLADQALPESAPEVVKEEIKKAVNNLEAPLPPSLPTPPETIQQNLSAKIAASNTDKIVIAKEQVIEQANNQIIEPPLEGNDDDVIEIEQLAENNAKPSSNDNIQVIVEEVSEEIVKVNTQVEIPVVDNVVVNDPNIPASAVNTVPTPSDNVAVKPVENVQEPIKEVAKAPSELKVQESSEELAKQPIEGLKEEDLDLKNKYSEGVKSDLKISFVYNLVPNNSNEELDSSFDPTKIQVLPTQYNKEIKINNFEFINKDYQILSNGSLSLVADDTMPSGNLSIIIQNHDNFIGYLKDYVEFYLTSKGYDLSPVKQPATEVVATEIEVSVIAQKIENVTQIIADQDASPEVAPEVSDVVGVVDPKVEIASNNVVETTAVIATEVAPEVTITAPAVVETPKVKEIVIKDSYDNFLKKIYDSLSDISTEIADKNPASTNEESRYEVKREKNLEFRINDTPVREVLGKF